MAAATASTVAQQLQDMRRGDLDDEGDDGDLNSLPPRVVIGPDENSIRKVIEYRFDDEGNKVKVITIISPVRPLARAPNSAEPMKGDAGSRLTNVSTKGILMEGPQSSGNKAEEPTSSGAPLVRSSKGDTVIMKCMICHSKGHHWTAKCPSRALPPTADGPTPKGEGVKRAYPPAFMMGFADRIRNNVKRITNGNRCVRVANLSEEARESDLAQLFGMFGSVTCVYLPMDENGSGSGVGYVKFAQRSEAEAAIRRLNGWIYDDLTLQVGWALGSTNDEIVYNTTC